MGREEQQEEKSTTKAELGDYSSLSHALSWPGPTIIREKLADSFPFALVALT